MINFVLIVVASYLIGIIPAIMWIRLYNHFKTSYYEKIGGGMVLLSWIAPFVVIIWVICDIIDYIIQDNIWGKGSKFLNKLVGK